MPLFPGECLVRARLLPISQWAVCASLDALEHRRDARRAPPSGFPGASHPHDTAGLAGRARVYRRGGDPGGRASLPLPARVQSPGASTDQVGSLRHGGAHHARIWGVVPTLIIPTLADPDSPSGSLYQLAVNTNISCLGLLIPLSFGFAMLRYRLWDIDVLINRTLVYGTLTVLLTGVYISLIIGLSALLRGLINQGSGLAIVLSTPSSTGASTAASMTPPRPWQPSVPPYARK